MRRLLPLVLAPLAVIALACGTNSNGKPVINLAKQAGTTNECRNDARYGACQRWVDSDGQRYTGSNEAYQAHVRFRVATGLCATAWTGASRTWVAQPNDDAACNVDPTQEGWPLVYGWGI
jgi:hypothetical protein